MEFSLSAFLTPLVIVSIVLTVIFTELIKKLDKNNKLKGYRVYIPGALSLIMAGLLALGEVITIRTIPLYWAVIFGFSVFGYETILKRFGEKTDEDKIDN